MHGLVKDGKLAHIEFCNAFSVPVKSVWSYRKNYLNKIGTTQFQILECSHARSSPELVTVIERNRWGIINWAQFESGLTASNY